MSGGICSFVCSLHAGVQPTLDPSAETYCQGGIHSFFECRSPADSGPQRWDLLSGGKGTKTLRHQTATKPSKVHTRAEEKLLAESSWSVVHPWVMTAEEASIQVTTIHQHAGLMSTTTSVVQLPQEIASATLFTVSLSKHKHKTTTVLHYV